MARTLPEPIPFSVLHTPFGHVAIIDIDTLRAMTSEHEKVFKEKVKERMQAADFVQGWAKDELDSIITALDGWDDLDPKERSERHEKSSRNLYKLKSKYVVVELPGGGDATRRRRSSSSAPRTASTQPSTR